MDGPASYRGVACSARRRTAAFTLIELMIVIGLVLLMTALLVPTFSSLLKNKGLTSATNDISELIDMARTNAMARNTYVWLGFYPTTVSGQAQLWVVGVRSLDGTPNINAPNNTRVIGKVQRFERILFTDSASMPQTMKTKLQTAGVTPSALEVATSKARISPGLVIPVGGVDTTFTQFITFTPQGEGVVTTTPSTASPPMPFTTQIFIGLQQTPGTTSTGKEVDVVAIDLYGGTGQIRLFRL